MSLFLVCLGGVGFGVVMLAFIIAWHGWWLFALPLVPIEMSACMLCMVWMIEG